MPIDCYKSETFVVDDDPTVRETHSHFLSGKGYGVTCFADGDALLAVARIRCPVCVLLDVEIPGKSRWDILAELHAQEHPAPVLIISSNGNVAVAVNASSPRLDVDC